MAGALASSDDLRLLLGAESIDSERADLLLDAISSEVYAFTGQSFDAVLDEQISLDGSGTAIVMLPGLPVHEVLSVSESGVELDAKSWEWNASGILRRLNGIWLQRYRNIVVHCSHGFATVPPEVTLLVCRVAPRGYVNPTAVTNESMGGYVSGYGYDAQRLPALSSADRDVLRPYMTR